MAKYIKKTYNEMECDSLERAETQNLYVEQVTDEECLVHNLDKGTVYNVRIEHDIVSDCDCPHHIYRLVNCKHMYSVSNELQIGII